MSLVKKIPVPACGLALGLACLGNLLVAVHPVLRWLCGGVSLAIILLFTLRVAVDFKNVKAELKNPVAFSVLPTYTMAVLLLAAYLKPFFAQAAFIIWVAALVLQFIIIGGFTFRFVFKFNIAQVFPSWFITFVGFVVASVTAPAMGMQPLGRALFYAGFVLYLALLPVVLYRVFKVKNIPPAARPTLAIFCAPIGLCLAGYLSSFEAKNTALFFVLLALCAISYFGVLFCLPGLFRLPFFPSYSSFTFPLAICAVGFKMAAEYLGAFGISLWVLPQIMLVIAAAVVLYVLVRYIIFLFFSPAKDP